MASSGRSRGLRKQLSSEDQALNMIAKEAEARLAAKRAARAEARSIRMKELERKQREIDELESDEVDMPPRRSPSSRISSPAASSPSGSETNINGATIDSMKDALKETEEKYRKAMVNSAQLDNERQALMYQVECLKDIIETLEESLYNARDELLDKTKEHTKLNRDHEKTTENLKKYAKHLQDRERILDEHGINLDGSLKENEGEEVDGGEPTYPNISYSNHIESSQNNEERESLLSEIESLKNEVAELKSQQESSGSRKSAENTRMVAAQRADLERSFVDVSTEAAAIREESTHRGMYVNNNEKCDEFEVIDDGGSQQGGIQNFEDKSFEKSGRSSLLSSMMTTDGAVTDSMESELPLEISIDKSQTTTTRDEYDIVQIDEPKQPSSDSSVAKPTTALDIQSLMTRGERAPSPVPQSNININKYLFSDTDDDGRDEPVTSGTFNIDMYFCADEKIEDSSGDKELIGEEAVGENDSEVAAVVREVDEDCSETGEQEKGGSPFVEVEESQASNSTIVPIDDAEKSSTTDKDQNNSPEAPDGTSSPIEGSSETLPGNPSALEGFVVARDDDVETVDSTPTVTENILVADLESNKPSISSSGNFTENKPMLVASSDNEPTTVMADIDTEMRKSVENLYEQIAEETVHDNNSSSSGDGLPKDATFGVFSITATSDMSRDKEDGTAAGREFPSKQEETPSEQNASTDATEKKNSEKWLVRVESFSMPSMKTPEIKVIEADKNHMDGGDTSKKTAASKTAAGKTAASKTTADKAAASMEPTPVPKERTKKKNKKKRKADKEHSVDNSGDDLDSPSPPGSHKDSTTSSPIASPTKRIDHSDIPKQFLDASTHLAGDSCSETSDVEHDEFAEDGSKISKKRGGSKKGKSKEGCKTQ